MRCKGKKPSGKKKQLVSFESHSTGTISVVLINLGYLIEVTMVKLLSALLWAFLLQDIVSAEQTCSWNDNEEKDPNLKEMTFNIGNGKETFLAYVTPNVTTFYQLDDPPASKPVTPKHTGLAGMFINMSNKHVRLYW